MVTPLLGQGYSLCCIYSSLGFLGNTSLAIYGLSGSSFCAIHLEIVQLLTLRDSQTVVVGHLPMNSFLAMETACLAYGDDLNDVAG